MSDHIKRFPVAQHIHVEAKEVPVEKSFFHNCGSPTEFNELTLGLGYDEMTQNKYAAPILYLRHIKGGMDLCRMMNVQAMIDFDPDLLQASIEMAVSELNATSYAFMMRCWTSLTRLHKLRTDNPMYIKDNPHRTEAIVAYCEFEDGQRSYMRHVYGQIDDVLFWEAERQELEIPPHFIPGRMWRLFESPAPEEPTEEGEEE